MKAECQDSLERGVEPPRLCTRVPSLSRWTAAFYAPAIVFPLATRLLVLARDNGDLSFSSLVKGAAFGCIQDAAVFMQTLVLVRGVLHLRDAVYDAEAPKWRNWTVNAIAAMALFVAYFWLTLACLVDLSLVISYMPRINRSFVIMYLQFSSQFSSSIEEVLTVRMVFGMLAYIASAFVWVFSLLKDKVQLPGFSVAFCGTMSDGPRGTGKSQQRETISASSSTLFPWMLHSIVTSVFIRTSFFAVLIFVSAVHATIALDGNGNDIYQMSNAMFSLETEEFLRAPAPTHADIAITESLSELSEAEMRMGSQAEDQPEETHLSPFYEGLLGHNEVFKLSRMNEKYPFWRRTEKYVGEKRFDLKPRDASSRPPNVLLINLESFRSLEVGVIGGKAKKAKFNQTVTPFFDSLSKTGILFTQHYSPSVQTSRTLLSSLFGMLPSMEEAAAVSTYPKTKLRLYGLTHILKSALNYTNIFWSAVNLAWEDWRGFLNSNGFEKLVDEDNVVDYLTKEQKAALTSDDHFSWGRHDCISFNALENYLEDYQRDATDATPPLFMDIYTVSSHDPWRIPKAFKPSTNYSAYLTDENKKYVNALNYVDQCLGKFITNLRAKSLLNNTIVLIEGDHGYGRMEHGTNPTIVASYVYDEGTHIPMLMLADGLLREEDKGMVVDEVTSQTDLLATITDLLGVTNFLQHGTGQSMVRKRRPEHGDRGVVLENPFYGSTRGLRIGEMKYARYGSGLYEVFNLTQDPFEFLAVEKHRLKKKDDGTLIIDDSVNATTAERLRFVEEVVSVVESAYEGNGFAPPFFSFEEGKSGRTAEVSKNAQDGHVPSPSDKTSEMMDIVNKAMKKAAPSNDHPQVVPKEGTSRTLRR